MSSINIEKLKKLVSLDLSRKPISVEDSAFLNTYLEPWRKELVDKLKDVDLQLTKRRLESLSVRTPEAYKEYQAWKKSAVGYKLLIVARLSEIKSKIKIENIAKHDEEDKDLTTTLRLILNEVREIRRVFVDVLNKKNPD